MANFRSLTVACLIAFAATAAAQDQPTSDTAQVAPVRSSKIAPEGERAAAVSIRVARTYLSPGDCSLLPLDGEKPLTATIQRWAFERLLMDKGQTAPQRDGTLALDMSTLVATVAKQTEALRSKQGFDIAEDPAVLVRTRNYKPVPDVEGKWTADAEFDVFARPKVTVPAELTLVEPGVLKIAATINLVDLGVAVDSADLAEANLPKRVNFELVVDCNEHHANRIKLRTDARSIMSKRFIDRTLIERQAVK